MKIYGQNLDFLRSELARAGKTPAAGEAVKPTPSQAQPAVPRNDSVQISDAGRARAAELAQAVEGPAPAAPPSELTPERIDAIRQRILTGAYDSAAMVEQVARRILESGDLNLPKPE
jgi:hypothetical protein